MRACHLQTISTKHAGPPSKLSWANPWRMASKSVQATGKAVTILDEADRREPPGPYRQGWPHGAGKLVAARTTAKGDETGGDREAKTPPLVPRPRFKRRAALGNYLAAFRVPARPVTWVLIQRQHNAVPTIHLSVIRCGTHHQLESQFLVLTSAGAKRTWWRCSVALCVLEYRRLEGSRTDRRRSMTAAIASFKPTTRRTTRKRQWAKLVQEDLRAYLLDQTSPRVRIDSITPRPVQRL